MVIYMELEASDTGGEGGADNPLATTY